MIAVLFSALLAAGCEPSPTPGHPVTIPTEDLGGTFYALPRTQAGAPLRFYTDSGGGTIVFAGVAASDGFAQTGSGEATRASLPRLACDAMVPPPRGGFFVAPQALATQMPLGETGVSGILGAAWLDGRTWTWDYPGRALLWRAQGDTPQVDASHRVALGFQKKDGAHTTGFPRIAAEIDGRTYQFLLDTGAHTRLTPAGARATGMGASLTATSFVTDDIAQAWHAAHPDWPFVANAEVQTGAAMIRVPNVRIGGYDSGPAWFTVRPTKNFTQYMSQWMDHPVIGSIGGSVLQRFRVTVDYASEEAFFEVP